MLLEKKTPLDKKQYIYHEFLLYIPNVISGFDYKFWRSNSLSHTDWCITVQTSLVSLDISGSFSLPMVIFEQHSYSYSSCVTTECGCLVLFGRSDLGIAGCAPKSCSRRSVYKCNWIIVGCVLVSWSRMDCAPESCSRSSWVPVSLSRASWVPISWSRVGCVPVS